MKTTWKHTLITILSAAGAQYFAPKVPGVDPIALAAGFAGVLAHLFHVKLANGSGHSNGNGGGTGGA